MLILPFPRRAIPSAWFLALVGKAEDCPLKMYKYHSAHLNLNKANSHAMKLEKVTERMAIPVWSMKSYRLSDGNQRGGKTPCRWKHSFTIIPQAAIENPLIYLDDIMSYCCSPAFLGKGGWRFPLSCTTTVLSAAGVILNSGSRRLWGPLLKWWYDNGKHTVQHRLGCVFAQLHVTGILEIKIPESQEFRRLSLLLWLVSRKKKSKLIRR